MTALTDQLASLPPDLRDRLSRHGFDVALLEKLAASMDQDPDLRNRLTSGVEAPWPSDIDDAPAPDTDDYRRCEAAGAASIQRGELAFIVLAGGMATRMGGLVKALVPAVHDKTFLDLRLAENRHWSERAGRPVPLWLMTSFATDAALREALDARLTGDDITTFVQNLSVRLAQDGTLFRDASGDPSLYAPGHGDLPESLRRSGLLRRFVDRGGRYLWVANIDNVGATIDASLLGWHIGHGKPVSVEVVDKVGSDKGGIPVRWNGRPVILEEFRVPRSFDPATVRMFNTNTFLFDARAILDLDMSFTWVQVKKKADGREAVQFERLIGEVTTRLDTRFVRVPRQGTAARFLPVKDLDELEKRRDEMAAVASARGML